MATNYAPVGRAEEKPGGSLMRVLTLGAGAIGGYFGGRLAEGGAEVTFLVRDARKRQLVEQGIRIESALGDYKAPAKAITADEIEAPADVVLLTCKAYDLPSAIDAIRPSIGEETLILPLLNGMAHMELLNHQFGSKRVLGGVAKIAAALMPDGSIKHLNDWRYVTFGTQSGEVCARVTALKDAFDRTSVVASVVPNIKHAMWEKVVHLATAAGMTCLLRANVGEIARVEGGSNLMVSFLERNAEIATREGYAPSTAFIEEYRALFSDRASTYTSSMLRDLERGGAIEADHIIGFMLQKARQHGVNDSLHQIAYIHLKSYEERRAAHRI
ncbi:MAG: 2-dehydropantoate 2-reductase [Steroidobacteraceae bacterium]